MQEDKCQRCLQTDRFFSSGQVDRNRAKACVVMAIKVSMNIKLHFNHLNNVFYFSHYYCYYELAIRHGSNDHRKNWKILTLCKHRDTWIDVGWDAAAIVESNNIVFSFNLIL